MWVDSEVGLHFLCIGDGFRLRNLLGFLYRCGLGVDFESMGLG